MFCFPEAEELCEALCQFVPNYLQFQVDLSVIEASDIAQQILIPSHFTSVTLGRFFCFGSAPDWVCYNRRGTQVIPEWFALDAAKDWLLCD